VCEMEIAAQIAAQVAVQVAAQVPKLYSKLYYLKLVRLFLTPVVAEAPATMQRR
jgi:hypothetical protein